MAMQNPYTQYQTAQVNTTPEKLVTMLYEGAIKFLRFAQVAGQKESLQEMHNNIVKAEAIIAQLRCGLDFEQGGEIATNLDMLYEFMYNRLVEANIKKDITMLNDVIGMLSDLRQTWVEAIKLAKSGGSNQ